MQKKEVVRLLSLLIAAIMILGFVPYDAVRAFAVEELPVVTEEENPAQSPVEPDQNTPVEPDPNAPVEPDPNAPVEPDPNAPVEPDPNTPVEPVVVETDWNRVTIERKVFIDVNSTVSGVEEIKQLPEFTNDVEKVPFGSTIHVVYTLKNKGEPTPISEKMIFPLPGLEGIDYSNLSTTKTVDEDGLFEFIFNNETKMFDFNFTEKDELDERPQQGEFVISTMIDGTAGQEGGFEIVLPSVSTILEFTQMVAVEATNLGDAAVEIVGYPDRDYNADYIMWEVDVNRLSMTTTPKISDALLADGTLELDTEKGIKIYDLTLTQTGKVVGTADVSAKVIDGEPTFPLKFKEIKKPYRVVYYTKIPAQPLGTQTKTFANKAAIEGTDASADANVIVKYPKKIITKSVLSEARTVSHDNYYDVETKKYVYYKTYNNPDLFSWTVDVNKGEQAIVNGNFTDKIPDELSEPENIKIVKLNLVTEADEVYENGKVVLDNEEPTYTEAEVLDYSTSWDEASRIFTVNVPDTADAFRITYDTKVLVKSKIYEERNTVFASGRQKLYINNATLSSEKTVGTSYSANVRVRGDYPANLTKTGYVKAAEKKIEWFVSFNASNLKVPDGVVFTDVLEEGLTFVPNSLKVSESKDKASQYFETKVDGQKVTLKLLQPIEKNILIKFETTMDPVKTYGNKICVSGEGYQLCAAAKEVEVSKNLYVYKYPATNKIDYDNKVIPYTVQLTSSNGEVTDVEYTDTFEKRGMSLILDDPEYPFEITRSTPVDKSKYEVVKTYNEQEQETGFKVIFAKDDKTVSVRDKALYTNIKYYVRYDRTKHVDYPNGDYTQYVNSGRAEGYSEFFGGKLTSSKVEKVVTINFPAFINNASKSGVQDGKNIKWTINLNYLDEHMGVVKIVDKLSSGTAKGSSFVDENGKPLIAPDGNPYDPKKDYPVGAQSIEDETFKVYKATRVGKSLKKGEEITDFKVKIDGDKGGFTLDFTNEVEDPYVIEYETKVVGLPRGSYANSAVITSGDGVGLKNTATVTGVAPYDASETVIKKEGKNSTLQGGGAAITWKVDINEAKIPYNSVSVRDTLGDTDQTFEDGTITLSRVNVDGSLTKMSEGEFWKKKFASFEGREQMLVDILEPISDQYVLEYQTMLLDEGVYEFTNDVEINVENQGWEKPIDPIPAVMKASTSVITNSLSGARRGALTVNVVGCPELPNLTYKIYPLEGFGSNEAISEVSSKGEKTTRIAAIPVGEYKLVVERIPELTQEGKKGTTFVNAIDFEIDNLKGKEELYPERTISITKIFPVVFRLENLKGVELSGKLNIFDSEENHIEKDELGTNIVGFSNKSKPVLGAGDYTVTATLPDGKVSETVSFTVKPCDGTDVVKIVMDAEPVKPPVVLL